MKNFNISQCGCVLKNLMNNLGQNEKQLVMQENNQFVPETPP